MPTHLSPWAAIIVIVVTVALVWINRGRDTRYILQTQFLTSRAPEGRLLECTVRFPLADVSTPCMANASAAGLYLVSTPEQARKWRWVNNLPFLKKPVLIPWSQLKYRQASWPARSKLRFDIRNTQATFFIPKTVALELLRLAEQPLPTVDE